jgi:hypothetical protein
MLAMFLGVMSLAVFSAHFYDLHLQTRPVAVRYHERTRIDQNQSRL